MFEVGQRVKVVKMADEFGDKNLLGKEGQVVKVELSHGCGELSDGLDGENTDPMYMVMFEGEHVDSFWTEELEKV